MQIPELPSVYQQMLKPLVHQVTPQLFNYFIDPHGDIVVGQLHIQ